MVNSGLCRVDTPSLRKLRLISKTFSKPPTTRRLRYSSGAMRRNIGMSSALWWVSNGLAAAPPGMVCSIGVSTSRKPRSLRKWRMWAITWERTRKVSRTSSLTIRST
ncbi:hypothetical protein D3C75_822030 [compost metagenome]